MGFLRDKCKLVRLDEALMQSCQPFTCGDKDLDDFFFNDALRYQRELLGKTYCFVLDEAPTVIVCMFTLSNDSIRVDVLPNNRSRKVSKDIPREKHMRRYPGVLIGRLGINESFAHSGIGTELMFFLKSWFIDEANKTGCRFLIVDAYNKDVPLRYYEKNEFQYLFSTEAQEAANLGYEPTTRLHTRLMFYDLKNLVGLEPNTTVPLFT